MVKWKANKIGNPDTRRWEVSVCKEDNKPGLNTIGGYGREKIMIARSPGGLCPEVLWKGYFKLAETYAEHLNKKK